jgi:Uncharacterized conserved protein
MIKIKRVYEEPQEDDGIRVLVDRLWPRGLRKEEAKVNLWLKDLAPSNDLRKWFSHDPSKWEEFKRRYIEEIKGKEELRRLLDLIKKEKTVTLLYSTKDEKRNNAVALLEYLNDIITKGGKSFINSLLSDLSRSEVFY